MDQLQAVSTSKTLRRLCGLTALISGLGILVCSIILAPLFVRFVSDVMYKDTWWVYLLYTLTDGGLIDTAVIILCYPLSLYAVWLGDMKQAYRVPLVFALMTLLKYAVNLIYPVLTYEGVLPDAHQFAHFDLPIMLANYGLEMLEFAVILLLAVLVKRAYTRKKLMEQARELMEDFDSETAVVSMEPLFPFTRLLALRNPIQLSAFLMALTVTVVSAVAHQIYQSTLYYYGGTEGLKVMAMDMTMDLFMGVIAYFAALLLISRLHRKHSTAQTNEEGR
jgi:hypothetical protein